MQDAAPACLFGIRTCLSLGCMPLERPIKFLRTTGHVVGDRRLHLRSYTDFQGWHVSEDWI